MLRWKNAKIKNYKIKNEKKKSGEKCGNNFSIFRLIAI